VGAFAQAPARAGAARPFAGVTINGAMFQHTFSAILREYVPEFEQKTGMKVNFDLQAFPVYNQRTDLELATKGSAYDFLNVTFIYSARWIGAGWFANLEEYMMPAGPKGFFPLIASHALGIPIGSRKKEAAWEFIKWALSKEMTGGWSRSRITPRPAAPRS